MVVKTFFRAVTDLEWLETEREVRFFAELYPDLDPSPGMPRVLFATLKGPDDLPIVVMEDIGLLPPPDAVAGGSPEATVVALDALTTVHARFWNDETLTDRQWLRPLDAVGHQELRDRAKRRIGSYLLEFGRDLPDGSEELIARATEGEFHASGPPTYTLLHGAPGPMACHLDGAGRLLALLSWHQVAWGTAAHDLAWLLGGVLSIADRRAHEDRFLASHAAGLAAAGIDVDAGDHRARYQAALITPLLANVSGDIIEHPAVIRRRAAAAIDHHLS